jgi:hypothetical protein
MAARDSGSGGTGVGLDLAAVRALPGDAFVALLLRQGRYRVDLATGDVVSSRTGRPMAPQRDRDTAYLQVLPTFAPRAIRAITVHRLVAIAGRLCAVCYGNLRRIERRRTLVVTRTVEGLPAPR